MSGIAGLVALDGRPIDPSTPHQMVQSLAHRGPHGLHVWSDGPAALTRATFHTSPGSHNVPGLYDDGTIVVSGDLRLDDRDSLAAQLELNPSQISDLQLVCSAYRRWGNDCPEHLAGDFAFALWDRRNRSLFCARDHFGVRPFYYFAGGGQFAFGSEVKAVIASRAAPFRIREKAVGEYLSSAPVDPERTFYEDIISLRPAHRLLVSSGKVQLDRYWSLALQEGRAVGAPVEAFIEAFDRAVARRLRSTGNTGAFLSGGLDSSSIVRTAAPQMIEASGHPLPTLSAVFDKTPQWSERAYIESVLAEGGCSPRIVSVDDYAPFERLQSIIDAQDGPVFAPGMGLTRRLYSVARSDDLQILLDGHGGDETVSHGYGRLGELAKAGNWPKLWEQAGGVSGITGAPQYKFFLKYFLQHGPLRPAAHTLWRAKQALRGGKDEPQRPDWSTFINPDFARRIDLDARVAELTPETARGVQAEHLADLTAPGTDLAFQVLDHQAAASGLEIRYPFWDRELVELCLNLPPEEKFDRGWTRLILRKSMEGRLPADVQWRRSKLDFRPLFVNGLLDHHSELMDAVILDDSGDIGGYVDMAALAAAYQRMKTLREQTSSVDVYGIYRAVVLSEWRRGRSQPR